MTPTQATAAEAPIPSSPHSPRSRKKPNKINGWNLLSVFTIHAHMVDTHQLDLIERATVLGAKAVGD
jgi:hypothetical protein